MKNFKFLLFPLLLWLVSCDEEVPQNQPDNEVNAPLIARITYTAEDSGESTSSEYIYEDGLLTAINSSNNCRTVYTYENEQLISAANFREGEAISNQTYTYRDGVVTMLKRYIEHQQVVIETEYEYVMESPDRMLVNVYRFDNGSRELNNFSICVLEEGNVVEEFRYDADGALRPIRNLATFNTVLDPLSNFKGHPAIFSANMPTASYTYHNTQLWFERQFSNYELTEHNYPAYHDMLSISDRGDSTMTHVTYEYYD